MYGTHTAALSLNVVVVGCGLGGLAAAHCLLRAGHHVTIVESSLAAEEVGAGIQVPPNSSRLLHRWGLAPRLEEISVRPEAIAMHRYHTGERIGYIRLGETLERNCGAPQYYVHRADLHRILLDLVVPHVTLRLGSTVVDCDPDSQSPSVSLASGEVIKADLIVGADGIKSYIQQVVVGEPSRADPTGDAAYRAVIPTSLLLEDPELKELVEEQELHCWLGPEKHIVTYPIRGNKEYNIVMVHPDDGSIESWAAEGSVDKMRQSFDNFEPRIRKLLSLVSSTRKWRLMDRKPLDKWVHDSGRVTLLGDACHPMLPYRAQGAAMAIEDAAVLGNLFSRLSHASQIQHLLLAYQQLRLPRTADAQRTSRFNREVFHLPDGLAQMERDKNFRAAMEAVLNGSDEMLMKNPNMLAIKAKDLALYGYDADLEVDRWWSETGKKELAQLVDSS